MLSVGIVGLPNAGKSTVLNALCRGGAKVAEYAFCTVDPNRATVPVPDARLERVAEIFHQERAVPAAIEFVDIAGLVRGASRGEGLGNQFLAAIREADAILHVVRCFSNPRVAHPEGSVEPVRDVEIVESELILADSAAVERRREKMAPALKGHDKDSEREAEALSALGAHLNSGRPARSLPERDEVTNTAQVYLLTDKPEVYLANVGEGEAETEELVSRLRQRVDGPVVTLTGKLEADLWELEEDERAAFAAELEVGGTGLERVITACYQALGLVTFFTGVGAEARAWAVPRGTLLAEAAGRIHSDMESGFIRAEVIDFEALAEAGSWEEARHSGRLRVEGRDYEVREGDVLVVRFRV